MVHSRRKNGLNPKASRKTTQRQSGIRFVQSTGYLRFQTCAWMQLRRSYQCIRSGKATRRHRRSSRGHLAQKLILVNGPNFIFRVLIPFIQIQNGIIAEATLQDGTKTIISSVPQPASSLDPEKNAAESAAYAAYTQDARTMQTIS